VHPLPAGLVPHRDHQILDRTEGQIAYRGDSRTEAEPAHGVQDVHLRTEQRFSGAARSAAGPHVLVPVALVPQSSTSLFGRLPDELQPGGLRPDRQTDR
jgi:hypothetical protein